MHYKYITGNEVTFTKFLLTLEVTFEISRNTR
ncbi:hypothetical protein [Magpiepox virus 2]|nr:hypothetical protein [Magpiepox virus 2]QZW33683.1 hypothetical protein [Magpiepox virus 2]